MLMAEVSPRAGNVTFGVIALLASAGLAHSLGKSLWIDEAASLYSAHLSWHDLWRQSKVVDRVFLPYYAILHVWLKVSFTIQWARALSLIAYAFTIWFVGRVAFRLMGFWCGVAAAVLCACNPLMIDAALNARPYALTALAATLSVSFLLRWFDGDGARWIWWFVLGAIACLLLNIFSVLGPLAALVALCALRPRVVRDQARVLIAPFGVLFGAVIAGTALTVGQRGQVSWIPLLKGQAVLAALYGPAGAPPPLLKVVYTRVALLLVAFSLVLLVRAGRSLRARLARVDVEHFVVMVAWAALTTLVLVAVSLEKGIFVSRYVTSSAPGFAIALGMLVVKAVEVQGTWPRALQLIGGAGAVVLVVVLALGAGEVSRSVEENIQQASLYLGEHVGPTGVAAYPDLSLAEGFSYYSSTDHHPVASWPLDPNQITFIGLDLLDSSSAFAKAPSNVWIASDDSATGTKHFEYQLRRDGYVRVGSKTFSGPIPLLIEHFRR
jgi:hypothetical protein